MEGGTVKGKHLQGPWSIELDMIRNGDIDVVADGLTGIAHVDCRRSPDEQRVPRETALANARLIAASPDLLTALRDLCDAIPETTLAADPPLAAWEKLARGAIAKAEGREP